MRATRASGATAHGTTDSLPANFREIIVTVALQADDHELLEWYIDQPHVRGSYGSVAGLLLEQIDALVSDICLWQREDAAARSAPVATRRVGRCHV